MLFSSIILHKVNADYMDCVNADFKDYTDYSIFTTNYHKRQEGPFPLLDRYQYLHGI